MFKQIFRKIFNNLLFCLIADYEIKIKFEIMRIRKLVLVISCLPLMSFASMSPRIDNSPEAKDVEIQISGASIKTAYVGDIVIASYNHFDAG